MSIDKLNASLTRALERTAGIRAAEPKAAGGAQDGDAQPVTMDNIQRAAAQLDSYMKNLGRSLEFKVDEGSGRTVVSVRDSETGELIRQIPSEEVLRMARYMDTNSLLVSITA